jgi:signal transduction histidine kinase
MIRGALSNIRDLGRGVIPIELSEDIELAGLLVEHLEIECIGISRALAHEAGRTSFASRPERIDAGQEIGRLLGSLLRTVGRTDLQFSVFEERIDLLMDRDSFRYVFHVLLDNAVKYSDNCTRVEIAVARRAGTSELVIRSVGLPIDPPEAAFGKFERGKEAWKRDDTGIGLGCWAAREHMRSAGGDIYLETAGRLSAFRVRLPDQQARGRSGRGAA